MAKVFINGATGFFGSHLVEHFIGEGHEVTAAGRRLKDMAIAKEAGAHLVLADITDVESLRAVIDGFDVVVNVAGIFDMAAPAERMEAVNHQGVRNVCQALKGTSTQRLVQISTVAVYGAPETIPCPEDAPKAPVHAYGRTKWLGEQAAFEVGRQAGVEVTALRPTLVYGPRAHYGHTTYLAMAAINHHKGQKSFPTLTSGPKVQSVHIEDICRAAHLIAFADGVDGEAYNITDDSVVTLREFMRPMWQAFEIGEMFALPYTPPLWKAILTALIKFMPDDLPFLNKGIARDWKKMVGDCDLDPGFTPRLDKDFMYFVLRDLVFDNSKIKDLGLALKYPDYADGMADTVRWYREHRWLP